MPVYKIETTGKFRKDAVLAAKRNFDIDELEKLLKYYQNPALQVQRFNNNIVEFL
ncbi:MAG: type II toxin-antitoxin system YafQ family toxin [Bacteroidales bacterium]|nr:type II toxin-antitoxin system YafQ family toxin [Bacteroidales bacterium]